MEKNIEINKSEVIITFHKYDYERSMYGCLCEENEWIKLTIVDLLLHFTNMIV